MIDNFNLIAGLLNFESTDDFYLLKILIRKKDNPELLLKKDKVVKTYYINNLEYFFEKKEEIINLCKYFKARAYINISSKSYKKCTLQCITNIANIINKESYKNIIKCIDSTVGSVKSANPYWIIDIDILDTKLCDEIYMFIIGLSTYHFPEIIIPTKNGYHLITKPFNLDKFKKEYSDINVHKNNSTVLYVN